VESVVIGALGTAAGLALGIVLGRGLVSLVAQTINDLYFTVAVNGLEISGIVLAKGAGIGLVSVIIAALAPAREATMSPPRTVLSRSVVETQLRTSIPRLTALGAGLVVLGSVVLLLPSTSIYAGYAGLLPILLGSALFVPALTIGIVRLVQPLLHRAFGFVGSMASRGVTATLSRTGVAIAALMIAVASTIGVGVMVKSFRQTVVEWLTYTLSADVYISTPSLVARRADGAIDSVLISALTNRNEIMDWNSFRTILVEMPANQKSSDRLAQVITTNYTPNMAKRFHFKNTNETTIWRDFQAGSVFISEAFAFHNHTGVGSTISLKTDRGAQQFRVAGVYYEYASDVGIVFIERSTYNRFWNDRAMSGISLYLKPDVNHAAFIRSLETATAPVQRLNIRSNRVLLATSLEVFDRTFAITDVLRLLTIIVSFVGVLSALMALQLEKAREIGVLRANGMTPQNVWFLMTLQTGLIGVIAGVLALPVGLMLAYVLIYVINQRSFGWTLQFSPSPDILLQAAVLAVLAAVLAGVYPAWRTSRTSPALALREE
jgi:putative ABC transport system permease protein